MRCAVHVSVTGLLAVGYTDGGVELQQYQCDADARCRGTLVLASHKDYMPVSSLTWATAQQVRRMHMGVAMGMNISTRAGMRVV